MNPTPQAYAIHVDGHLDDHWSIRFSGLTITRNRDATTTLAGPLADQAQLHGTLAGLRDIGAILLSLHATDPSGQTEPPTPTPPANRPLLGHPLHTKRLTLRPARIDDADPTWKLRQLNSANESLTTHPADIASYRDHFAEATQHATIIIIQLGHDPAAEIIGDLTLRRGNAGTQRQLGDQNRNAQAELGWILDPAHHGHGYTTEAVHELLRLSFEDLGLRRVTARCFLHDNTSWQLMERLGMRRETHAVRESLHHSGRWLDTVTYALLADEWRPPAEIQTTSSSPRPSGSATDSTPSEALWPNGCT